MPRRSPLQNPGGKTVRLFSAIQLSQEVRHAVAMWMEHAGAATTPGVRWVRPEQVHLTVRFFGRIEEAALPDIASALTCAVKDVTPFDLELYGAGAFPDLRRPRVVWVDVREGRDEVKELQRRIAKATRSWGETEARAFAPHVTVARVKELRDGTGLKQLVEGERGRAWGKVRVDEIELLRSDLTPRGSIYSCVAKAPLAHAL